MNQTQSNRLGVRELSLEYRGKLALGKISLSIPNLEITAIIGPSGCGKTSFLYSLNRLTDLIPGCKVVGEVLFEGRNILGEEENVLMLRRRIGMIFQKPNPLPLSIRRNIEFPLKEHGVSDRSELDSTLRRALEEVGLWSEVKDRLETPALSLSGGQQQRLCIARALALNPEVLLLDEPCSALDPISSGVVEDLIHSLKNRLTILIVTHNLAQARRISDHTALFWFDAGAGRLIECGPTGSLFENPKNELTAAYIHGVRG
jgi:phosphate transport system ATP-binding protein